MKNKFQIIGIRPLDDCHEDFRKNLKTDRLYLFDQRYKLDYDENNQIVSINYNNQKDNIPNNFYSDKLNIWINAVVGANGSGKSALAELFLYFMFYYGINKGHISKHQFPSDSEDGSDTFKQVQYTQELRLMSVHLNVELLYIYDDKLYHIFLRKSNFNIEVYEKSSNKYIKLKSIPFEIFTIPFYSMYVNYSHYGLNTNVGGVWLRTLFHKNDGYQLPVVINPYRDKGNVDINIENYLSRDRVFTNVIDTSDKTLILPNIEIEYIEIVRDSSKNTEKIEPKNKRLRVINLLIKPLFKIFFGDQDYPQSMSIYQSEVEDYLIRKIKTITERYLDYKQYYKIVEQLVSGFTVSDEKIKQLLQKIYVDRSHVTLKIRQSLNFLHRDIYKIKHNEGSKHFKLSSIVKGIDKQRDEIFFTETIDFLPPPIFMTRFHFKNKSHFDQLSSGEKQQIFSIHSIIYHLKNIDSVHKSIESRLTYNSVFLILDEIELYYHPQAQKKTIERLLYVLEKANLDKVKHLNVVYLTHSPFILSDIPSELTLKLKDGKVYKDETKQRTFAANITDLLTDSFFLENGLIGDFAKRKIDEVIAYLNYKILNQEINQLKKALKNDQLNNKKTLELELAYKQSLIEDFIEYEKIKFDNVYIEKLIDMIDEPLLRDSVQKLFEKAKAKPNLN